MKGNFPVILDACVLVQACLRDTLLRLAQKGMFLARWSDDIINETSRTLQMKLGKTPEQVQHLTDELRRQFDDAWVEGYAGLIPSMSNDEKDRHILAAAIVGRCECVVTLNMRHFPAESMAPFGIEARTPDEFLINLYGLDPVLVVHTLHEQGNDLKSMRTIQQILAALQPACPQFVQLVRSELDIEDSGK